MPSESKANVLQLQSDPGPALPELYPAVVVFSVNILRLKVRIYGMTRGF